MSGVVVLALFTVAAPTAALAQTNPADGAREEARSTDGITGALIVKFLAGAAVGLGAHEGGHLLLDVALDADPGLARVRFGPLPFFAITHRSGLSHSREYTIDAAGFWMQHVTSEWLLTARPRLRGERAPLAKGVLAWHVLSSTAYSAAAFGTFGPRERDTRGMAGALGVPEPLIGVMVLTPAVLDAVRYYRPDARWPRWLSRGAKIASVVLIVVAARR